MRIPKPDLPAHPVLARLALTLALAAALGAPGLPGARAQDDGARILVHTLAPASSTFPGTAVAGLKLSATLTLLEGDGSVIRTPIKDGQAGLRVDGLDYAGDFGLMPPDWSVVWLVDTSGTLGNSRATADFRAARDSLARAAQGMPDNTNVALIKFSTLAPTQQELAKDRERLGKAMAKLTAAGSGNACLNDGLFEAVNKLIGLQGRKAVFVFTASADTCNTRPLQQVLDLARANEVQIYAVGLEGYAVSQSVLDAMTTPTGGLGLMTGISRLGPTLDNLNAILSNQWQVVWTVCPPAGPQSGALKLTLTDTRVLAADLAFDSDRAYACPPTVQVAGLQSATRDRLEFNLNITNLGAVQTLEADITNKATGRTEVSTSAAAGDGPLVVPADQLKNGTDYELVVRALDAAGQLVAATAEPFPFKYEPVAPSLRVVAVEAPTMERDTVIVTATVNNPSNFDLQFFKAWLVTESGNTVVPGTETTVPAGQSLTLPAQDLQSGSYLVQAQALDGAQQPQAEATPFKLVYTRPTSLDRLVYQLRQTGWALPALWVAGGVALAGLAVLAFFLFWWPSRASRVKVVELALPEMARHSAASAPPKPAAPAPARPVEQPKPAAPPPARPVQLPQAAAGPAAAAPRAALVVVEPKAIQFQIVVNKSPFKIGRRADNDGALPVQADSGVSGLHCVITFAAGHWYVQDDASTYGTTLNGQPVPKGQPVRLPNGAVLGLGPVVKVQFRLG